MTAAYACEQCEWHTPYDTGRGRAQADRHERLQGHTTLYVLEGET